jgi:hypothetical protein
VCGAVPSSPGEATVPELRFYKVRAISALLNGSEGYGLDDNTGRRDEILKIREGIH